jgi:hypothetical protein
MEATTKRKETAVSSAFIHSSPMLDLGHAYSLPAAKQMYTRRYTTVGSTALLIIAEKSFIDSTVHRFHTVLLLPHTNQGSVGGCNAATRSPTAG